MADKVVIYQKADGRVPIAKVPTDEVVESAIRKANVDLGLDPYGPASDRYADAKEHAAFWTNHPDEYDQRHAPTVKKSVVPVVLAELAKSHDPRAIAKLLNNNPGLYDLMASW
jgi:hypothetical protein